MREIERISDRFENALRRGLHPHIEEYLDELPGSDQTALFRELLEREVAFRRDRGDEPALADYIERFPYHRHLIHALFGAAAQPVSATVLPRSSTVQSDAIANETPSQPVRLGRYEVSRQLGKGSMGTVYLAHDTQLDRSVALKVLTFATDPSAVQRFRQEARAAAGLDHPNICRILDVGAHEDIHFLTMVYVEGQTLDEMLPAGGSWQPGETARMLRAVALAVEYAHKNGVVHRDLKPSNIMIRPDGSPVVMDFGLARRVEQGDARLTQNGVILGTPHYMSPEQARADQSAVGPTSDVYSLGVILYEMLAGQVPFPGKSLAEVIAQVVRDAPPPPSQHRPGIDRRLEAICLKAMAKRRHDRYATAGEMAAALSDYIRRDETKRRPPQLLAAAGLAAILLLGTVFYVTTDYGTIRIEVNDPEAVVRVDGNSVAIEGLGEAIRLRAGSHDLEVRRGDIVIETRKFTIRRGKNPDLVVELLAKSTGPMKTASKPKEPAQHPKTPRQGIPADTLRREQIAPLELAAAGNGDPARAPAEIVAIFGDSRLRHWATVGSVVYSQDGTMLASAGWDRTAVIWDAVTGRPRQVLKGHGSFVVGVALAPDGKTLASTGWDNTVRLWDCASGQQKTVFRDLTHAVAFSPRGDLLAAAACTDQGHPHVKLFEPDSGRVKALLRGHEADVTSIAFSPNGKLVASGSADKTVRVWSVESGMLEQTLKDVAVPVAAVTFSPDQKRLAAGGGNGKLVIWDTNSWKAEVFEPGFTTVAGLSFHPAGHSIAVADGGNDFTLHILDLNRRKPLKTIRGHSRFVNAVAFRPDGKALASAGSDHTIRIWDANSGQEMIAPADRPANFASAAFSPDGACLAASGFWDQKVRLWDVASGKILHALTGHKQGIDCLAFSPDGATLATASRDGTVKLWHVATGKERRTLPAEPSPLVWIAFSPDGKTLAARAFSGKIRLWDLLGGGTHLTLDAPGERTANVDFSPDGRLLAAANGQGAVTVWRIPSGAKLKDIAVADMSGFVAFRPSMSILAVGCGGNTPAVRLWNLETGQSEGELDGYHHGWDCRPVLAFDPTGRLLASSADDGRVRLWDLRTGAKPSAFELGPPGGHIGQVSFSPDGQHVATANGNGTVYILRLSTAR